MGGGGVAMESLGELMCYLYVTLLCTCAAVIGGSLSDAYTLKGVICVYITWLSVAPAS